MPVVKRDGSTEGWKGDNNARRTCSDDAKLVPSDNKRERKTGRKERHGKNGTEIRMGGWKSETLDKQRARDTKESDMQVYI